MGKKIQEPRTKGNVKPSKSDNAAQFLATKKLDNVQGFAGLAGGLGFMRTDNMDSDVDSEIRQIFRRLDKKDTLTKQKALQELLTLSETKEEAALLGAFPYWPRLYSRLSQDGDNKVRAASHKVMSILASRCGRNMAPHLKSILPVWILGRGDDYEAAATAATAAFESTFPPSKRADALRHAWTEVFDAAEEALLSSPPACSATGDEEAAFSELSRHMRSVSVSLRALTLLFPLVKTKEEAAARLLRLLRDKKFWCHFSASNDVVRTAYLNLVVCLCKESPDFVRQPACAAAVCEVVLRDVNVESPLVASSLWDAILLLLEILGDQAWRHVSLRKTFLPNLATLLSSGGHGVARHIFPCLLPLFARLGLGAGDEGRQTGEMLLRKAWEGLHQPRVLVVPPEASALAQGYMECCRYLVAEGVKAGVNVSPIVDNFAIPALFETLTEVKVFQAFGSVMAEQFVLLLGLLHKRCGGSEPGELYSSTATKVMDFVGENGTHALALIGCVSQKSVDGNEWAQTLMVDLANVLLTRAFHPDRSETWLPFLAAIPTITDLPERFPPSPATRAIMTGLEPLLRFLAEREELFKTAMDGLCRLFALLEPEDCAETIRNQFTAMEESSVRLLFLSQALPLFLVDLPLAHSHALQTGLEPSISAWARDLIVSVFARLDSGAETTFRGVLEMLLHHLPPGMTSLWAFRAELVTHVAAATSELGAQVRKKCRRLVAMLCHFLVKCGEDAEEGGRTESLEEVILQLHIRLLRLLSFETTARVVEGEEEEEEDAGETVETVETVETTVRRLARKTLFSHVRRRLEKKKMSEAVEQKFLQSLVTEVIEIVHQVASDNTAKIICEEFGVELFRQLLEMENDADSEADAERPFHHYIISQLLLRSNTTYKLLDSRVTDNFRFHLTLTTREMPQLRQFTRSVFLITSLTTVSASLMADLTARQHADGVLSRLVLPCLFAAARISDLGVGKECILLPSVRDFEQQHRKLLLMTTVLETSSADSCLWPMVVGDLMCRHNLRLSDASLLRLEWLDGGDEREMEEELLRVTLKDLPFLLQDDAEDGGRAVLFAAIESRISAPVSPRTGALCRLLDTVAQIDPGTCPECLRLFLLLHGEHEELLFAEGPARAGWRLEMVLATLRLLRQCVRHRSAELDEAQWDVVLCSCVSWLSSLPEAADDSTEDEQRFAFDLLLLLSTLGATVPVCDELPTRIREEWASFYAGHLYDAALSQFLLLLRCGGCRTDPGAVVLCDAVSGAPAERLMAWDLPARLRADERSQIGEQRVLTIVNTLGPLLEGHEVEYPVQTAACSVLLTLAKAGHLSVPETAMESEEVEFQPPQALVDAVRRADWLCQCVREGAEFGGGAVGLDRLLEVTDSEGDGGTEGEDHSNPMLAQLAGFLMTWRVVLSSFAASTPLVKARFASWLAESGLFDQLLRLLFRILPLNPAIHLGGQLRRRIDSSGPKFVSSVSMFERQLSMRLDPAAPFMRRSWLLHLSARVYMQVLRVAPALMRQWWLGLTKKESSVVERYTERQISPILVQSETEIVNARAPEVFPDQEVMSVKGKPSVREIHAVYRVTDEHRTELLITLPTNYPLGPITVQTFKKIGISAQQWRSLQLQMTTFLQNQNGTVLEGLSLWKRNIDTKMEGVEDCMICFSILHGSNYQLPRMTCHTCKKKFHAACLYKWFQTSQNHTCPLCRNMFEMSRH